MRNTPLRCTKPITKKLFVDIKFYARNSLFFSCFLITEFNSVTSTFFKIFLKLNSCFRNNKEWFGYTLAGCQDDLLDWLSAFHLAQYGAAEVLPRPSVSRLVN